MSFTAKKWSDFVNKVGEEKASRIRGNFDATWSGINGLLEDVNNASIETALHRIADALEVIGDKIGLYKTGTKR